MRRRLAIAVPLLGAAVWLGRPLPDTLLAPVTGTELRDRHGALLAYTPASERAPGHPLTLEEAGPDVVAATLAAEDHRFRLHPGVDPVAVVRAARANLHAGRVVEGGSTLTQQLARNVTPRGAGLLGKLGEALLAVRLEFWLEKDQILAEYLSRVFYGNAAVGIDAAARLYFDRPPAALSLAQAATLAAIPRRPADLDPLRFPLRVRKARDRVLDRLEATGLADAERVAAAREEPLILTPPPTVGEAPHFVRRAWRADEVVATTLDLGLQHAAEEAVVEILSDIAPHHADHAAVIVLDNPTMEVLAYVGSGRWGARDGQVDGVTAARSSGSTLKPFLYGLALQEGATLADVLSDTPGTWSTTHGAWKPENYDHGSAGPVTLREALARSLNLPAVRLADRVGTADLYQRLRALGFSTLDERPDHYGLSLALGGADVRLDELAAAYATLANGGIYRPIRLTMDTPRTAGRQVYPATQAFQIADALDDASARAPAFGIDSVLEPSFPMAAKTGTSTGWRDNWAVGVTPTRTVAVWVGNFDGRPMADISGVTGAGPILARVMAAAMEDQPRDGFARPPGLVRRAVCPLSGMARGASCPDTRDEWFPRGKAERATCDWHTPEGTHLPTEFSAWANENHLPVAAEGGVAIVSPTPGATYWIESDRPVEDQAVPLRVNAPAGRQVEWRVDDRTLSIVTDPYSTRWVPTPGEHDIHVLIDGVTVPPVRVHVAAGP